MRLRSLPGPASYYSVDGGRDVIWYHPEPRAEGADRRDALLLQRAVDIELDGELQERPESPLSHRAPAVR